MQEATFDTRQNNQGTVPQVDDPSVDLEPIMCVNVAANLTGLKDAIGATGAEMARKLQIAAATYSTYANGRTLPLIATLAKICQIGSENGYQFTMEDFLFKTIRFNGQTASEDAHRDRYDEYLGSYYLYFFNQASSSSRVEINSERPLRYGVLSVYRERRFTGDDSVHVCAKFFKALDDAIAFRGGLDAISSVDPDDSRTKILDFYEGDNEVYRGELSFTEKHMFLVLVSEYFGDKALAIFNVPPKKEGTRYIGGLGNMVSVTHGQNRLPTAQRIIASSVRLNASPEEIGIRLRTSQNNLSMEDEANDLLELYKRLYPSNADSTPLLAALDDKDKTAIFSGRLRRLITNAIDKQYYSVSAIRDADDKEVYTLIQDSMNNNNC